MLPSLSTASLLPLRRLTRTINRVLYRELYGEVINVT
jgi:hypothetical protein